MVLEPEKHLAEMVRVLLGRKGDNKDAISVHRAEVQSSYDPVHEGLSGIAKPEVNEGVFKQPKWHNHGGLRDVVLSHRDLMESLQKLNLWWSFV